MATKEQRARHSRTYYENGGKEKIRQLNQANRARNFTHLRKIKESTPCAECGKFFPHYVMDFDHLPGCDKVQDLAYMANQTYSIAKLDEEIAKCEVVCSNCHRTRTWMRSHPQDLPV